MLKNIPAVLSPELLKTLCEMGHGDTVVIADGNFPAESVGRTGKVIRLDGHGVPEILDAVLKLMPLDHVPEKPAILMAVSAGEDVETPIWEEYNDILLKHGYSADKIGTVERQSFYDISRRAYAVVATGETALYANILLQKGVVTE